MDSFDVVVAGAGPAGSTTATLLAAAGVRVALLEREHFPRYHVGESLVPASRPVWQRLGIEAALPARYLAKPGVRFLCSRTEQAQTYAFGAADDCDAYQVPRADFDELLTRNAAHRGATVRHGWTVREVQVDRAGTVVGVVATDGDGARHEIAARVVVDATGRDTLMAARVGERVRVPGLARTAIHSHFAGVERQRGRDEGTLDIVVSPHGWFWSVPFRGEVGSVGVVVSSTWMRARRAGESLDAFFDRTVADTSWARRLLAGAQRLAPVRATADYRYDVEHMAGDGWIAVGDCTGFVDPLFCSGVHLAFCSGAWAADALVAALAPGASVDAARWRGYEARVQKARGLYELCVRAFYDGPLQDLFLAPDRRTPATHLASLLAGTPFEGDEPEWARSLRERFPHAGG